VPYKPAAEIPVEQKPQPAKETAVPETPASQEVLETQDNLASPEKRDIPATPENPSAAEKMPSTAPVFKVQILASATPLKTGNSQFKGLTDVSSYQEGGMYKYTVGASSDYQEIYQLRKSIVSKFPQAFIIAFRGSEKMDVNEAIREYKSKKVKK
jgi:N-acetylmuramoyl-L-alanine amidase